MADGDEAIRRFQSTLLERVRALPGVTAASAINMLPIANTGFNGPVRRLDQTGDNEGVPVTEHRAVMDRYFETMGVAILAGGPSTIAIARPRRRWRSSTKPWPGGCSRAWNAGRSSASA